MKQPCLIKGELCIFAKSFQEGARDLLLAIAHIKDNLKLEVGDTLTQ
jgi:hypothetical protein